MSTPVFDESFFNISLLGNVVAIGILAVIQYSYIKREAPVWLADSLLAFVALLLFRGAFSLVTDNEYGILASAVAGMILLIVVLACAGRIGPGLLFLGSIVGVSLTVDGTVNRAIAAGSIFLVMVVLALVMHRAVRLGPRELGVTVLCSWSLVYVVAEYFINGEYTDKESTLNRLMKDVKCGTCWPEHTAFSILVVIRLIGLYLEISNRDSPNVQLVVHLPAPPPATCAPTAPRPVLGNTVTAHDHERRLRRHQQQTARILPRHIQKSDASSDNDDETETEAEDDEDVEEQQQS